MDIWNTGQDEATSSRPAGPQEATSQLPVHMVLPGEGGGVDWGLAWRDARCWVYVGFGGGDGVQCCICEGGGCMHVVSGFRGDTW
jgi:hypothetical protein